MPTFLDTPEILPLPNLKAYTSLSVLLLSCSVWYAYQVTSEPDWKLNTPITTIDFSLTSSGENNMSDDFVHNHLLRGINTINETTVHLGLIVDNVLLKRFVDIMYLMFHEPLCNWTVMNIMCCIMILIGKVIQKLVFGNLRVSEQQHLKSSFWNFVFFKFIFIFGVLNLQSMFEIVLWCSWFSLLGFLLLWAQLCRDRFEYLSFSPTTPRWTHFRLLTLLTIILLSSVSLFGVCILVGLHAGLGIFTFMFTECFIIFTRALYVLVRYMIHLWDINHQGVWENRASLTYYTELIFELTFHTIDFFHHLHMLFWGNIIISMASIFILMQLRASFNEIRRRMRKHKNYLQVINMMEENFPMATDEELEKNCDDCAICWDKMDAARRLPCNHLFHNSCLRSWLEQDTSCPTCRTSLKNRATELNSVENEEVARGGVATGPTISNRFFHFDGSQYASWLPSVSVAVHRSNTLNIEVGSQQNGWPLQTELMSMRVHELFPELPLAAITADIRETQSIDSTIENILDGRLTNEVRD